MAKSRVIDRDRGWRGILGAARAAAGGAYVKVGMLADDQRGGLHVPGAELTVAELAVVQEFGTEDGHVPARSFVRSTHDRMRDELLADARKLLIKLVLDGKPITVADALDVLGLKLATGIRKAITEGAGIPPPNAPSTVAQKGSDRPLVDTGRLLSAISWAVVIGGQQRPARYVGGRR